MQNHVCKIGAFLIGLTSSLVFAQAGGGTAGTGQLTSKPSMLEIIWEDAFGSPFINGSSFIWLLEPDAEGTSDVWHMEKDLVTGEESATLAGDLLNAQYFPVEWFDTLEEPFDYVVDGMPTLGDVTITMDATVGQLMTDNGYNKWVSGLTWRIYIDMAVPDAGDSLELMCFLPLARHSDEASAAQYTWEYSLLEPPYPENIAVEACFDIFMEERAKAWTDYSSDRDNCDARDVVAGGLTGLVAGGLFGLKIGTAFPGIGNAIGLVGGAVIGAVASGITDYQLCIDAVKEAYRKRFNRHWTCYEICLQNGDETWPCSRD